MPVKRRKMNPTGKKKSNSGPKLWFDVLPGQVLSRIIALVALDRRGLPPLELAKLSCSLASAITELRRSRYEYFRSRISHRWAAAFAKSGTTTHLALCPKPYIRVPRTICCSAIRILASPALHTAEIPAIPSLLAPATQSRSLRALAVHFYGYEGPEKDSLSILLRSAGGISLRKLDIVCTRSSDLNENFDLCIFREMQCLQDEEGLKLARSCPHLVEFGSMIGCSARCRQDHRVSPFWRIWLSLPNIRTATIPNHLFDWKYFDPRVLRRLKALDSVRIDKFMHLVRIEDDLLFPTLYAPIERGLGPIVTSVSDRLHKGWHLQSTMRALSRCVRISDLRLKFCTDDEGSLQALSHAVAFMPALKILSLEWISAPIDFGNYHEYRDASGRERKFLLTLYPDESDKAVIKLVRQTPALESLELFGVCISTKGLVAVLKHLGNRLKHFGVSLVGQNDTSFERFVVLMETICEHNCELQSVATLEKESKMNPLPLEKVKKYPTMDVESVFAERESELDELLRSVRRCVPYLQVTSLRSWIDAVMWTV